MESSIAEFDRLGREAFLAKYAFGPARGYFLLHDGRRYDSKAICGAAHGFDRPGDGPLRSDEFVGGNATVARVLTRLGFEVSLPAVSRTGWTGEERILALDLYLRLGVIGRTHLDVIALSEELNTRRFHPDAGSRENFRNPNGVALKLANFAAIDPSYAGRGMTRYSAGDKETWDIYAGDGNFLVEAVQAIRAKLAVEQPSTTTSALVSPVRRSIEQRHRDRYEVRPALDPVYAERREADLVERFAGWLRQRGAEVTAHHYEIVRPPLRNDLANETTLRLWEAKSDTSRSSVRMALGQLLDYLRFEPAAWSGGILLPHRPTDDLADLISSSGRAAAWPTSLSEFTITEPPGLG